MKQNHAIILIRIQVKLRKKEKTAAAGPIDNSGMIAYNRPAFPMNDDDLQLYQKLFKKRAEVSAAAPGRINVIGEHTDYNGGYVLPAAIHLKTRILAGLRNDDDVHVWAENFGERVVFPTQELQPRQNKSWPEYVKGIFWVLREEGFRLRGLNILINGDVPIGAGLSSSAALEVSLLLALEDIFECPFPPEKTARLGQKAENEYVGVKCGLMDQFIAVFGQSRKALFLDCETLEYEHIPLDLEKYGLGILIYDTQVKRSLASSEYNQRRREAAAALDALKKEGVSGYKRANLELLERTKSRLESIPFKRARHIISENARVQDAVAAMKADDFARLGRLLFQSHESLRDDYEVSCPELDLLVEVSAEFAGCLGARMVGAGFGGSGIALIQRSRSDAFKDKLLRAAAEKGFPRPVFRDVSIGEGAKAFRLEKFDGPHQKAPSKTHE